jgi:hypothetical protein
MKRRRNMQNRYKQIRYSIRTTYVIWTTTTTVSMAEVNVVSKR